MTSTADYPTAETGDSKPPTVVIDGDSLHVHNLSTRDGDVLAAARKHSSGDLCHFARASLETGAKVLTIGAGGLGIEALAGKLDLLHARTEAATNEGLARVRAAIDTAIDPDAGPVATSVRDALTRLCQDVENLVAGESAPVRRAVVDAVERVSRSGTRQLADALAAQSAAVRASLSTDDPNGPFSVLASEVRRNGEATRSAITAGLTELRGILDVTRERKDSYATGQAKGFDFEGALAQALTRSIAPLNDVVDSVGKSPRPGSTGKRVDLITTVGHRSAPPGLTVAIEAKARADVMSSAAWLKLLDQTAGQRGSAAALGVVCGGPEMVPGGEALLVITRTRAVVSWSPGDPTTLLHAAYVIVRTNALAHAISEAGQHVDLGAVRVALADLAETLGRFDQVQRAAGLSVRHATAVTTGVEEIRAVLATQVDRVSKLLGPSV